MKAISCLASFTGQTDNWTAIRKQYGLQWSTGTEKIDAFTRFFDSEKSLDVLLTWLKEAMRVLPSRYANLLLFCTLTGMRGSEVVESVRLLTIADPTTNYYNQERQILQHYLYPNLFIRRTKAIYISVVNDEIIWIAKKLDRTPTLAGLKKSISNRKLSMHIKYCRKIHASWLHHKGISSDLIDVLQGRISRNIFLRDYLTPDNSFKSKVLDAVGELQKELSLPKR
jgi:intergrase/recombinase